MAATKRGVGGSTSPHLFEKDQTKKGGRVKEKGHFQIEKACFHPWVEKGLFQKMGTFLILKGMIKPFVSEKLFSGTNAFFKQNKGITVLKQKGNF